MKKITILTLVAFCGHAAIYAQDACRSQAQAAHDAAKASCNKPGAPNPSLCLKMASNDHQKAVAKCPPDAAAIARKEKCIKDATATRDAAAKAARDQATQTIRQAFDTKNAASMAARNTENSESNKARDTKDATVKAAFDKIAAELKIAGDAYAAASADPGMKNGDAAARERFRVAQQNLSKAQQKAATERKAATDAATAEFKKRLGEIGTVKSNTIKKAEEDFANAKKAADAKMDADIKAAVSAFESSKANCK